MEKIQIFDNIIPDFLVSEIEDFVINKGKFPLYYAKHIYEDRLNSVNGSGWDYGFKNTFYDPFKDQISPISYLFNDIFNYLNKSGINIKEVYLGRLWVIPPYPQKKHYIPHIDNNDPHWVCLYYINDSDGDTIFFEDQTPNSKIIKRVSPKRGRVVIFEGSLWHSPETPTKNTRAVINYNIAL